MTFDIDSIVTAPVSKLAQEQMRLEAEIELASTKEEKEQLYRRLAKVRRRQRVEAGEIPAYPDLADKGKVLTTTKNMRALLDWMGVAVWRNLMSHTTEWVIDESATDIPAECRHAFMLAFSLDHATRHGWQLTEGAYYRCIGALEAEAARHPAADWAMSKPWDGVGRFDDLFATLHVAPEYDGHRDLMRKQLELWLIAGGKCLTLGRSSHQGVAVQGVLVLQGAQNAGKTRWFKSLVPDSSWIAEGVTMDPSNKDSVITATSSFIVELGELDATTRKSDVAMLKSFLTRDVDEYRAPFGRKSEAYPRRTIYGATVNPSDFLVDATGNRRFWLMPVERIDQPEHIDMQQLWAEACSRAQSGEPHWMPPELQSRQAELARSFEKASPWADDFYSCFRRPREDEQGHARLDVLQIRDAIQPGRNWTQADKASFSAFLKSEGFDCAKTKGVLHARVIRV